jgi:hypothetical protein
VVALVKEAFPAVRFCRVVYPRTVKVEVTVELDPTNPPNKERVEVALAPRAVTVAKVSVSASKYAGQFVPLERHTVRPFTNRDVVETTPEAYRLVVETLNPVALENRRVATLMRELFKVVIEPLVDWRLVVKRLVVVTLVPVASENESVPPLMSDAFNVVIVPVVAERTVVLRAVVVAFVMMALVAPRLVAVAFVNVAFTPMTF